MNPEIVATFPNDIGMVVGVILAFVALGFAASCVFRVVKTVVRAMGVRPADRHLLEHWRGLPGGGL